MIRPIRRKSQQLESISNPEVEKIFDSYPADVRTKLLALRQLILETAAETEGVGKLEETLKWGQPSYLTPETKSGTTIRIDQLKPDSGRYGIFVHCQTSLVSMYRELYSNVLSFDGKRAIELDVAEDPPKDVLRHCIELALTYHQRKRG